MPHGGNVTFSAKWQFRVTTYLAPRAIRLQDAESGSGGLGQALAELRKPAIAEWMRGSEVGPARSPPGFRPRTPHLMRCAMKRASGGPAISTITSRRVCRAITKDRSTLLEAPMMATESMPPGLVAR